MQQSSNRHSVCVKVCVLLCVLLGHTTLICCHICGSWLLRDMADQAPCVCLSVCVSVCVTGEAMARKGMWQRSHIQGPPPTGPQGLDFTIVHYTHTQTDTHVDTHMLFTEGHWGPVSLVTCVCNHRPLLLLPATTPHQASSSSFSRSQWISKQTRLERRINEININILRHWQAWKLKSGDGTLAIF